MKKLFLCTCVFFLFAACQSNERTVKAFLAATNSNDTGKISQIISEDFTYTGDFTLNKEMYLKNIDSLKYNESRFNFNLLNIQNCDSIVKTEEKLTSIVDSLLDVTPKIINNKTYRFSEGKLKSVTVDTVLNAVEYWNNLLEKAEPVEFWIKEQYGELDDNEIFTNIKKYLTEYLTLPVSERKKIKTYTNLQGVYVSDNILFTKLIFRGKKTVSVIGLGTLGVPYAASYELDENYVKIMTGDGEFLFEIKDNKTLIGEGFAEGTYKKQNKM